VTKVLKNRYAIAMPLAVCLALLSFPAADAQAKPAPTHQSGPAESLYLQLSNVELDPSRVFRVRDAAIDRPSIHINLDDGSIAFSKDVLGRITGAFFEGDGEVLITPPNVVERKSMSLFTGMAILEERFSTAYFRFNDQTAYDLQPGLRAPDEPEQFVATWNDTVRRLSPGDAMRLLASFIGMLPDSKNSSAPVPPSSGDRMLHARIQGNKLGVFDVFYDSTAGEQIAAGQTRTAENGSVFYDVWTSFSPDTPTPRPAARKDISQTVPADADPRDDAIQLRNYIIDAEVKPPKEIDAKVDVQLDFSHRASRCVVFELSRALHIQSVEADGAPVEFIQNPTIEGTQLARAGNDLVAVILPDPPHAGQKIKLHFTYGGEVLAEAGKGLLYVGARGTWYPNRGMAMSNFDLTFRYPPGWTLLATGKPVSVLPAPSDEQVTRWVSERPIPVAGFDLGRYVRGSAQAGAVTVEAYATTGVEKDFPQQNGPAIQIDPNPASPPHVSLSSPPPSPARNATAVAESAARAIRFYAERFGPFPYSQLALTQMPGEESQGWPGLVFLSSYAFLSPDERHELHVNAFGEAVNEIIPAHEAAHQWWGDLIVWATYRDQWFSEGLANYSALMMLQEKNPASFRLIMERYRQNLIAKNKEGVAPRDVGPVSLGPRLLSSHSPEGYEAISYGRGTWLFHMLRTMLQDGAENRRDGQHAGAEEPFVRALRKIRERYAGKTVTTRELLDVFAEELPPSLRYEGKDSLDWFLDGWINGTALPKLELQDVKFTAKANSAVVSGVIRQKDAPEDLVTSVPIYGVAEGKSAFLIGRVFADGPETSFRLSAPPGTHKVLLDPNAAVLSLK
jgi:Peptidase family M1 domain